MAKSVKMVPCKHSKDLRDPEKKSQAWWHTPVILALGKLCWQVLYQLNTRCLGSGNLN